MGLANARHRGHIRVTAPNKVVASDCTSAPPTPHIVRRQRHHPRRHRSQNSTPLIGGSSALTNLSDSERRHGVGHQERSGTPLRQESAMVVTCVASQEPVRLQAGAPALSQPQIRVADEFESFKFFCSPAPILDLAQSPPLVFSTTAPNAHRRASPARSCTDAIRLSAYGLPLLMYPSILCSRYISTVHHADLLWRRCRR